jgi:ribosomal protein S7
MPLSDAAAHEIANVLRKHLETRAVEQIVNELLEISRGQGVSRHHRETRRRAADD